MVAACAPKVVEVEKIVEKEVTKVIKETVMVEGESVEVTKIVKETVVVEKEVVKEVPVEKPPIFPEPVKLEVWLGWGPDMTEVNRTVLDRFVEDNPNVSYELAMAVDEDKFVASVAAGVPPDIYANMGNMILSQWIPQEAVLQLDPYIESSGFDLSSQMQAGLAECTWMDGKLYGMAWGTDTWGFMWNKDQFEEVGLDPDVPPKTWEELHAFADKLTKREGLNLTRVGYIPGYGCWEHITYQTCYSFGGRLYNEDYTQITLNTPEMVRAMEDMKVYWDEYGADNLDRLTGGFGDGAQGGFYSGKIAMAQQGEWVPGSKRRLEIPWEHGIGKVQYPANKPEVEGTTCVNGTILVIPTTAAQPDAAWELLSFLVGPWATAVVMYAAGNIPTCINNLSDPRFAGNPDLYPHMQLAFDPNAYTLPLVPGMFELFDELLRVHELAFHGKMDIEEGLTSVEQKLQPKLDEALSSF